MQSADPGLQIDSFLKSKGSPMAGLGSTIVGVGQKYGVDPRLLVGISGIESSFGKFQNGNYNAWGWGPGKPFSSYEEGLVAVARGLKSGYIDEGLTDPYAIAQKYAPASAGNNPQHWADTVSEFMRAMGAAVPKGTVANGSTADATVPSDPHAALSSTLTSTLSDVGAHGGYIDSTKLLRDLTQAIGLDAQTAAGNTPTTASSPSYAGGRVTLAPGADRPGVGLDPAIVDFARQVSSVYGQPLTIGTGSNHNQYVVGTRRQSAHWTGRAADIPATGATLTNLGRAALVAAGMPPAKAAKQRGGLFNLGGYQIIFNSSIGGNHYNHLHIGLRGG